MSQSQTPVGKTVAAAVERARQDVNGLKMHMAQLMRSEAPSDQNMARSLVKHRQKAETLVEQAESTVKRIKNVRSVPPRPTASVPPSVRAKRSLSVLLSGLESDDILQDLQKNTDEALDVKQESVLEKADGTPTPKRNRAFLSAAGKPVATPLREDVLKATLGKVHKETGLAVLRNMTDGGVFFECPNVFRTLVWFKDVDAPAGTNPNADGSVPTYVVPEHIAVFGVDETNASRWACSRYAVFKVITERANAAVRYFMAREKTGEDAFLALGKWLARHKTLFTAKCEDRRLAFDASRGIFLPSCIYPFEGHGPPRFTRGSIPLRSNSSYAAQPTVRVPNNHNQGGQAAQTGPVSSLGVNNPTAGATTNPQALPSSDDPAAATRTSPAVPLPAPAAGGGRMNPAGFRPVPRTLP